MQQSDDFKTQLLFSIPELRAYAISLCGQADRADDLVQETLLKAWANSDKFFEGKVICWLFTILRNSFYSEYRKRRHEVEDGDECYARALAVPPTQEAHISMIELQEALTSLPAEQREAIMLVGGAGMSYEEAASICSCAVGTIKSRVSRARNKLMEASAPSAAADNEARAPALASSPEPARLFA
jgi:RNA polymerase sigma-70 factor (ECF subfamily)